MLSRRSILVLTTISAVAALWAFTPLLEFTYVDSLELTLGRFKESRLALLYVALLFVAGGLVLFPVTVLMAATVFLWELPLGPIYALVGVLSSASLSYAIGKNVSPGPLRSFIELHTELFSRRLENGILSVAIVRHIPIAPFTVVNLVIGASQISFAAFFLGTLLGLFPSVMAMALLERQLSRAFTHPGWESAVMLLLFLVFVGGMLLLFRRLGEGRS